MSILCGTDFSPRNAHGVHAAAALARKLHDPIELVHVVEPIDGELHDLYLQEVRRIAEERLEAEAGALRNQGVEVHTHLPIGSVADSLDEVGNREHPRMLVVSALGRTAPVDWLLGSTAEKTAERIHVPTLVVRDSSPLEAWARGEHRLKVLVACDLTLSSRAALCWVRNLSEIGPCDIIVARVLWQYDRRLWEPGEPPSPIGEIDPRHLSASERDLAEWIEPLLGNLKPEVHCLTSLGRPDFELIEFAEQHHVDLIVTGTRQRHGLRRLRSGSFSRGLLRYAPMNVSCVPLTTSAISLDGHLAKVERVLVATDLSDPANRAISYGFSIVDQGGTLQLVSVVPHKHTDQAVDTLQHLDEHIPATSAELNINTEVKVLVSHDTVSAICDQAERFGAHVICLGTRGAGLSFSATRLGSVAQGVAARSRRPVLLVPHLPE